MKAVSASSTWTMVRRPVNLVFLCLILCLPLGLRAGEPEDFKILQKLVQEGAAQTALVQAKAYLEAYPTGAHRGQASAWAGRLSLESGDAEGALPFLESAIKALAPRDQAGARLDRARALVALKRYDEALEDIKGLRLQGEEAELLHRVAAEAYTGMDDSDQALRALQAIPKGHRTSLDSLRMAQALSTRGEDRQAGEILSSLLKESDGADPNLLRRVRLDFSATLYRLKDYDGAYDAVSPLLAQPQDSQAVLLAAWALHGKGQDARAYDLVRKAFPLSGWEEAALVLPLRIAAAQRDWTALMEAAATLRKRSPEVAASVEAGLFISLAQEARGDYPGALQSLEGALSRMQGDSRQMDQALRAAHLAWARLHDPSRALRWLKLASQVAGSDEDKARTALELARFQWESGRSSDALSTLATLVRDYPGTSPIAEAYLLLGQMRLAEGDWDQGRQSLQVVIDSFPDAPAFGEAALDMAQSFLAQGRLPEAKSALGEADAAVLGAEGRRRQARLSALIAMGGGEWGEASQALDLSVSLQGPEGPGAEDLFLAAVCQLQSGDIEGTQSAFAGLSDPDLQAAGEFRIAVALQAADKPGEAMAVWQGMAQGESPDAALARWCLADAQLSGGDQDAGLESLQRLAGFPASESLSVLAQRRLEITLLAREGAASALAVVPAFRESEPVPLGEAEEALRSARRRAKTGDAEGATKAYQAYLDRFPSGGGAPEAYLFIAKQAAARSDWPAVQRLARKSPPGAEMLYLLGQADYRLRDMPSAQDSLEKALAIPGGLAPDQALHARLLAGTAARIQGKTGDAVNLLEAYASSAPASTDAKNDLFGVALWLQRRGRFDAALTALEKLRRAFRDAEVGFQYGYTLELAGREEEALKAYLQVTYGSTNAQWALTARYRAAELMVTLGRKEDAIALYRELVSRSEGTVQGKFAQRRLDELTSQQTPPAIPPAAGEEEKTDETPAPAH